MMMMPRSKTSGTILIMMLCTCDEYGGCISVCVCAWRVCSVVFYKPQALPQAAVTAGKQHNPTVRRKSNPKVLQCPLRAYYRV